MHARTTWYLQYHSIPLLAATTNPSNSFGGHCGCTKAKLEERMAVNFRYPFSPILLVLVRARQGTTAIEGLESGDCRKKMLISRDVGVIVTGPPRSGTTILGKLIDNIPGLYSGFELGFLEGRTPMEYPFVSMLGPMEFRRGNQIGDLAMWGVQETDRQRLKEVACLADMYELLREVSPYLRKMPNASILDKCPAYSKHLNTVLARAPPNTPCIFIYKNMPDKVHRDLAQGPFAKQILFLNFYDFLSDIHKVMSDVFNFIGGFRGVQHVWKETYVNATGYFEKYEPVFGPAIARVLQRRARFDPSGGKCDRKTLQMSQGKKCHSE